MTTIGASNHKHHSSIQSLLHQGTTQSSASQSASALLGNATSQTFSAASPQSTSTPASTTAASSAGKTSAAAVTFPRFEPQTLQALLALQTGGVQSQS